MDALIILALIAGIPVLLALLLRVSGVFLFLSLASGNLLLLYLGDDAGLASSMLVRGQNSYMIAQLVLLVLPIVLSLFLLKRTLPKAKILLHLPLLATTGLALATLALPLFDSNTQAKVFATQYGGMLRDYQDVIIGSAAVLALLVMWFTYRHKTEDKHKKRH